MPSFPVLGPLPDYFLCLKKLQAAYVASVSCHIHRFPPLTSMHSQYKILYLIKYYTVETIKVIVI